MLLVDLKGESCQPRTMLTFVLTSNDIHLFPAHNQSPCTETHLSLRVDSLASLDRDFSLNYVSLLLPLHRITSKRDPINIAL